MDVLEVMKLMRVLNCLSFDTYRKIVDPEEEGEKSYWLDKFQQGKGNPFNLLAILDERRQTALWKWAQGECERQHERGW